MDPLTIAAPAAARKTLLSDVKARLIALDDDIAAIRAQIAAADMDRQMKRKAVDARWFHRAKTALRHLQRERAELAAAQTTTTAARRDSVKDALLSLLRDQTDPAIWETLVAEARRRASGEVR